MKNKKTSVAAGIFIIIYVLTIAGFFFSLKQEILSGEESAQDRFAILIRETSQNLNVNEVGSEAFYDRFLESLGNLSDIAGVQLKYNNGLIFSYPADIANGVITKSNHTKLTSTNINTKNNETLTVSAAIYKLKPAVFQRNLKIAFIVILATTLCCLACVIYHSLYGADKQTSTDTDEKKDYEGNDIEASAEIEPEPEQKNDELVEDKIPDVQEGREDEISIDDDDELFDDDISLDDDDLPLDDDDLSFETEDSEEKEDVAGEEVISELEQSPVVEEEVVENEDFFTEEDSDFEEISTEDDEIETDRVDPENSEFEESEEDESPYSKIQISPAEYSALQEAIDKTQAEFAAEAEDADEDDIFKAFEDENIEEVPVSETKEDATHLSTMHPKGLFSEKTGFGWEEYMVTRLDSELQRAASSEQDLSLFTIRIQDLTWFTDEGKEIADFIKSIVNFQDLIFEYETDGCTAILPNTHIDQSLKVADDLYTGITEILQQYGISNRIGIGISAKSLRMISGERLANESQEALRHAFLDETSPIVAFKVNPQKYRNFLAAQAEEELDS